MPIYEIEGPDKRIYEIEGPENASEADLISAARRFAFQDQQKNSRAEYEQKVKDAEAQAEEARKLASAPIPEGGFKAAARAGFERLQGDIAGVAGRTGIVDIDTAEKFKAEKEKRAGEIFQGTEEGWLESPWTKFKETLGGSAAYIAAPLIAGAGATLAGASAPISLTAAGLASLAQFTGSNLSRQMQEKGLGLADTDLLSAGAAAVPQAALDVVSFRMLPGINRIFQSAGKELTESQLKAIAQRNLLTNVGMSGGKIAGVEGLTEVGQQFLERLQADISTLDAEARNEYIESFIGGAVLGGTFGGVAGVGARGRARSKLEGIEGERAFQAEEKVRAEQAAAEQAAVTPQGAAPRTESDFLSAEEARIQKQRAGLERFGETAEFPSEISPTGTQTREQRQLAAQAAIDAAETTAPRASVQGDLFLDAAQRARAEGAPLEDQRRLLDAGSAVQPAAAPVTPTQDLFDAQGNKLAPGSALQAYDAYGTPVNVPNISAPAGQGRLDFTAPPPQEVDLTALTPRQRDTLRQAERQKQRDLRQQEFEAAEAQRAEQNRAQLDRGAQETFADQAAGIFPPTFPEAKAGQPSQPQQIDLFGERGRPSRAEGIRAGQPIAKPTAPAAPTTTVDKDAVDYLFLPTASAVRKNILGKDVADPEQRQYVASQLTAARDAFAKNTDPRSRTAVKRINDILSQSPFVRTQSEMFGPRGGVLSQPKAPKQGVKDVDKRTTAESTAKPGASKPPVGVGGVGVGTGAAGKTGTGGVSGTRQRGLADTGGGAKSDDTGAKVAPVTVKKDAYSEGVQSAKDGDSALGSPYPEGTAEHEAFNKGYLDTKYPSSKAKKDTEAKKETPKAAEKKPETKAVSAFDTMVAQMVSGPTLTSTGKTEPVAEKQKIVNAFDIPLDRPPTGIGKEAGDKEALSRALSRTGRKKLSLEEAIGEDLPNDVQGALKDGNLKDALNTLAANTSGIVNRILRALSRVAGDTKVKIVDNLKDASGKPVSGMFDPETNTIMLDSKTGLNNHTLMHETTHSALSHVLDNPNHPVTKQLTNLFNSVKPLLDTAYGATNVQEFVAEAWGNPEFRAKLSGMNPDGTNISALQKFVNTVANFMRRMVGMDSKSITSAFDAADELMSAIISPAPETRNADAMYLASARGMGDKVLNAAGAINKALPPLTERIVDNFHKVFTSTATDKAKKALLMSLPSNALEDIAVKYLPEAPEYEKLINLRSGAEQKLSKGVNAALTRAEQWAAKQSQTKLNNFNDVVNSSTLKQVDPSKPISAYAEDAEKLKTWKELQPKWNALGVDGKKMYTDLRDSYKTLYDRIADLLKVKMDGEMGSAGAAKAVNDALRKIMDNAGRIEPYFPLTRVGDFWLEYTALAPDGKSTEKYVEAFETPRARARAMEELKKDPSAKNITPFAKPTMKTYRNAPSGSFMSSVLQTLELNKVSDTATEEIMNLFLNVMPETAFAQSFRQREGVLGFNADAISAMRLRTPAIGRQLVNLEYGAKLSRLNSRMQESAKASRDDTAKAFADEYDKRIQLANSPDNPTWSQATKTFAFGMTLGFNVSSALVNLTQIPLVVMPYLGGKYGYGDTASAIARATRVFMGSGFSRTDKDLLGQDTEARAAPSLENIDFSKASAKMKHYATLARIAGDNGVFGRSLTQDILNVDGSVPLLDKVNAVSGFVFHHGERMNRQIGMIATYDLELKRMETKPTAAERGMNKQEREEAAAINAINMTNLLNGSSSTAGAPRIAQNALGSVALMYKRYGVSMYYMMFKTAREALKSQDAEVRHAAMRQIGGIFGSAALIAGVRGVPMFGVAALLYDMAKDDDEDDFRTVVNKWVGATAYSGGLNAVTGLEIGSRVGLSDLLFRDNNSKPDQSAILSMVEMLGGPALGIGLRAERGIKMINDGEVSRGIEQMLPAAFGNGLKALRYATEGATTVRGDPIMDEVSTWNVAGQAFGFAPAEYTRQLEINANEKGKDKATTEARTKLLRKFYTATRLGDSSEAQDVMEDIVKFNSKHPTIAITGSTIRDSMKKHAQTSMMMQKGVVYNKKRYSEVMQSLSEFNED